MKNKERKHMGRKKGETRKTDNYSFQAKDPNIRNLLDNQKILMNQFVKFSFIILISMVMEK
jgi:hypothetical protein